MDLEKRVECISILHKQNLSGRESEDELFEAGIIAGIEETELLMDKFAIDFAKWIIAKNKEEIQKGTLSQITLCSNEQLLEIFKRGRSETAA